MSPNHIPEDILLNSISIAGHIAQASRTVDLVPNVTYRKVSNLPFQQLLYNSACCDDIFT